MAKLPGIYTSEAANQWDAVPVQSHKIHKQTAEDPEIVYGYWYNEPFGEGAQFFITKDLTNAIQNGAKQVTIFKKDRVGQVTIEVK